MLLTKQAFFGLCKAIKQYLERFESMVSGFTLAAVMEPLWISGMGLEFGKKIMARSKRFAFWLLKDDEQTIIALEAIYPTLKRAQIVRLALRELLKK
jgi:hypothetical protein